MRAVLLFFLVTCVSCSRTEQEVTPRSSPLRDVVSSDALVGRRVLVSGRCVTPHTAGLGQPPDSNSWQLESGGVSLYIVGPAPATCDDNPITLTAFVAQDTLPAIGDLPATPRRYLIHLGPVK